MNKIPGQYPDGIHRRFINYTGQDHSQIQYTCDVHRRWHLSILIWLLASLLINLYVWFNPYHEFGWFIKVIAASWSIGWIFVIRYLSPRHKDQVTYLDYRQIGKTLKEIRGLSKIELKNQMEQYCLPTTGKIVDARSQVVLSKGIHELLIAYAFQSMTYVGRNEKKAEYWRAKFAQTYRVAVILRLIPHWYLGNDQEQNSRGWRYYFNPETVDGGTVPEMNWSV